MEKQTSKSPEVTTANNGVFDSKIGFVLACVGSAVGMGNIWMFPYRVGQYGGAAFLIPYFIFVILFGFVGLSGEFALGRLSGTGPIGSYGMAMKSRGKGGGKVLGAIPLFGSLGIAIGYAVIVGWVIRSTFGAVTGALLVGEPAEYFAAATGHFGNVFWHVCVIALAIFVLLAGVSNGIEKVNKVMMPAFFILFLILAVRVALLPGAMEGYKYLFVPKWEFLLNPKTWIMAMGQAFFSLSITGSGMVIYGSYLKKSENVVSASITTALFDTMAAMVAAFAIIPAVFAFGMDPGAGPPLMFITLPKVFQSMPGGRIFAVLFFISVLFAGITSLVNMFEAVVEAAQTQLKMKRVPAVALATGAALAVGLFIEYEPFLGKWMDIITIYVVPIGAVLGAIMIYWVFSKKTMMDEMNLGNPKPYGGWFHSIGKYVYVPLAIAVVIFSFVIPGGIG